MSKQQKHRMSDKALDMFLEQLEKWDGNEPSFQDIIIDAAAACARISQRNKDHTAFVADFAAQTGLAESLIRGWVAGKRLPNTKLAKTVVNEIRIFLEKKRVPPHDRPN